VIVSKNHPELLSNIEKAIQDVSKQPVIIPVPDYIKTLQAELEKIRKERIKFDPTAPEYCFYYLDFFKALLFLIIRL
jgi:hypothetical protein